MKRYRVLLTLVNIKDRAADGIRTNAVEDVAANSVNRVRLIQDGVEAVSLRPVVHHDCNVGGSETSVHRGRSSTHRRHQGDAEGAEQRLSYS